MAIALSVVINEMTIRGERRGRRTEIGTIDACLPTGHFLRIAAVVAGRGVACAVVVVVVVVERKTWTLGRQFCDNRRCCSCSCSCSRCSS